VNLDKAKILDFGCGQGIAAASFALRHPKAKVMGLDIEPINELMLGALLEKQIGAELPKNLSLVSAGPGELPVEGTFDLIYAWSVFEHVREDLMIELFRTLKERLAPGGVLFVQINPLYFSPQGSHLYKYFKSPWHHLILSLDQLRDGVLSADFNATQSREWRQFMELNRLTGQEIIGRATASGLKSVRVQFFQTDQLPPPRLTRVYNSEVLKTTEFMALFE
jgi:trans-aconitate methyltransferase